MDRGTTSGVRDVPLRNASGVQVRPEVAPPAKKSHGHLNDVGFGALVSYYFCLLASVSIRSDGLGADSFGDGFIVSFLAFTGATCLMLLFLALAESYLLRHDNHRLLAAASGVLMALGPAVCVFEGVTGTSHSPVMFLAFSLSGCGYAVCLLIWGRILSVQNADGSSRQVLADTCAAVIVMVAISVLPENASAFALACLGGCAGFIGARTVVPAEVVRGCEGQVVVSDTRNAIPLSSHFAGGVPWMIYGVFLALLSDIHVFGGLLNIAVIAVVGMAGIAGIAIVRLHRNPNINLSRIQWASVPLLVMGMVIFVAGEDPLLRLAVVLIVLSMIISYLHLMAHFAALAHRPDLLSDQLFAWGWLAPTVGMFVGVFAGMVCLLFDDPALKLFLSVMGGVLVVALIVSMRSVERIAARHREQELGRQTEAVVSVNREEQLGEVFSTLGLSAREGEVAALLLQGRSQTVIADQLYVAASTVNTHVKHIYRKAGVCSKQEFIDLCEAKLEEERAEEAPHEIH